MRNILGIKLAFAIFLSTGAAITAAQETYVAGPVESLVSDGSQLTILGQTIGIGSSSRFFVEGRKVSASRFARSVEAGSYVYAETSEVGGRLEAETLLLTGTQYVAGASAVFISGRIQSYSPDVGLIRIGALAVDVTALSPDETARLSAGDIVQVSGFQPSVLTRFVLISEFKFVNDSEVSVDGISGSGTQGISGSGTQGISGSGTQGISGSGTQGISGSGTQGISGSGTQGISGSGQL